MCGIEERCADLVLSGAGARPDERIWAQIALDVGRDYFSRNTVAGHEPLICARHGYRQRGMCGDLGKKRNKWLMSMPEMGQAVEAKTRRSSRHQDYGPGNRMQSVTSDDGADVCVS